ncbi:MAG: T9SS C-terminal target domain-containing protein [Saprospiraceae bacterium]|nr:T9SS C-terminal target domain-containing protein [Saprospiraceae bacterium]
MEVTLAAEVASAPYIPEGYQQLYVLTKGESLVIEQVGGEPIFTVEDNGTYTIHTLVYDPNTLDLSIVVPGETTGFDVNGLLIQGGGSICAALDVAGAPFTVVGVSAGTLNAPSSFVCFSGSETTITAEVVEPASLPAGYSHIYVLTSGDELVIQGVSSTPSFDVSSGGIYTIHSLVYDTSTLDLGIVELGVTTGFDVNGLLIQGGGQICASLDVAGARFIVGPDAGTLVSVSTSGCTGSFMLEAGTEREPFIPEGYTQLFVLTEGSNLVIQAVAENPMFEVTNTGTYTIHSLVYDPLTLDLGIVEFGVTTGVDVNGLLIQGGGSICASLDVAGAVFEASGPIAGTLNSESALVCFDGSSVSLDAQHADEPVVPAGYSVLYVLTQGDGLVIQQVGAEPTFEVDMPGNYTIHTLVYDANTLDLSIVVPGVTTGIDVNGLLVQGGGSICAALDVAGSKISVGPSAGTLVADNPSPMLDGMGSAMLQASVGEDPVVPEGFSLIYVLTSGDDLVIQNVNATPMFEVTTSGKYTIHTLVYDTLTLDLGIVEVGVTTGVDVNGLLVQGGGSICAALDVAGAVFDVSAAMSRSGIEIINVWYHAGIIYAEIEASKPMLTPLQVFNPGGLEVVTRRESISQGYNLLEVTLAVENPSSLYFVKIENQVFKIMKDW